MSLIDARTRLALLRDVYEPDAAGRRRAARSIIDEVKRAAIFARYHVHGFDNPYGIQISFQRYRSAAQVLERGGLLYVSDPHGENPHSLPFPDLIYDPVGERFTHEAGDPVDVIANAVAEILENQVAEQLRPDRRRVE